MSEEWKRQRSEQQDSATKNLNETTDRDRSSPVAAPQEQHATPTASSKADNDPDSDIEVLCSPQKAPGYKGPRRDSGSRKKGAARARR
jgi:hypothetical protein